MKPTNSCAATVVCSFLIIKEAWFVVKWQPDTLCYTSVASTYTTLLLTPVQRARPPRRRPLLTGQRSPGRLVPFWPLIARRPPDNSAPSWLLDASPPPSPWPLGYPLGSRPRVPPRPLCGIHWAEKIKIAISRICHFQTSFGLRARFWGQKWPTSRRKSMRSGQMSNWGQLGTFRIFWV